MSSHRGGLVATLQALPAPAWWLFGGTLINRFGSFVLVFLVLYLTQRGYSAAEAGAAVSVYGVGSMAASMVGGYLADHLGRRNSIALSMFAAAGAMIALSQAEELWQIIPLTGLVGFTSEMYRPAASALLADLTPAGGRVTAFAVYRLAVNLGVAAGPAVAGFLAERSFVLLFIGDAITSAAYGVIALIALPEGVRARAAERGAGAVRTILAHGAFMRLLLATTAMAFVFFQAYSTFPLQVQAHGYTAATYGMLMSLNGLLIASVELPLTSLTRQRDPRRVIALGYLLAAIGFGLTGVAEPLPLLALTVVVWTVGEMLSSPVSAAYVADLAPVPMRGRFQAAFGLSFSAGLIVAPTLGTLLYQASPGVLWGTCLATGLVAAWYVK